MKIISKLPNLFYFKCEETKYTSILHLYANIHLYYNKIRECAYIVFIFSKSPLNLFLNRRKETFIKIILVSFFMLRGDEMNIKQKRFALELFKCGDEKQAFRNAFKREAKTAELNKLSKDDEVLEYIETLFENEKSEKVAEANETLEFLTKIMRGVEVEAGYTALGEKVYKTPSFKERIEASKLLGKRFGIFDDNVNLKIEKATIIDSIKIEDDEE